MTGHPNVAILGCGRSGTSIFCELFDAFAPYTAWSEPFLSELPDGTADHATNAVAVKVPRTPPGARPPTGCSVSFDDLTAALGPDVVVFWQIRHPLDAIASLRPGIDDNWGHHPRPPDWEEWLDRSLIERCAHHWAVINGAGFEHVAARATVMRFEDLIADPTSFALAVAERIGVDAAPSDPLLAAWIDRVQDTNNERFVEAMTSRRRSRPDHERRVGRWRENLTSADVDAVWPIVAEVAARHGYTFDG